MEDVYVYTARLPGYCREMVGCTDGIITVVINSDLSDEQKLDALNHALTHIEGEHFKGEGSADRLEAHTHRADASVSPDLAPILRCSTTDEEIPVLRTNTRI